MAKLKTKINSSAKERITMALFDGFSFSDQITNEIVETICLTIEELAEEGIDLTKQIKDETSKRKS